MKKISIVLPVYNEQAVLPSFNAALFQVLESLRDRYEFHLIYVLDPSEDNSLAVLREFAGRNQCVDVLCLSRRFGHQMSLVAGIDYSDGDAVIMMDCDLQHPPEIIPKLLDAFERGFDIVQGIRRYDSEIRYLKRLTSRLFYKFQNALSPVPIDEGSADLRLISRKVAGVFRNSIREQNQFLRGLFCWVGYRSTTVSFVSGRRVCGSTKYDLKRLLLFSILGISSFSKLPLRLATVAGFVLSVLSTVYGLWSIGLYFFASQLPRGYTTLVVAMMFMGGLQLLVLGVLGEYVGSIFEEVKRRPLYIVDEIVRGEHLSLESHHGLSRGAEVK